MAQPDITVPDLHMRARRRADMVGSTFCSDTEVDGYVEQAFRELYMRLVAKYEDFFLVKATAPLTTIAGSSSYSMQGDLLKFRGVRHQNDWFLSRIDPREIPGISTSGRRAKPEAYWLHGNLSGTGVLLELEPIPDAVYTLDYYYVPFKSLSDIVAGSLKFVAGWDEYCVLSAAIKMKDKEETDCTILLTERAGLLEIMEKSMTPLDAAEPFAVVQFSGRGRARSIYDDPFTLEDAGYGD